MGLDGGSREATLAHDGAQRASRVAPTVSSALGEAHGRGLIHRSCRPDSRQGRQLGSAKVLGRGLGEVAGGLRAATLTREARAPAQRVGV